MDYIYVWADGTWCYPEDLEDYLTFMSDDFEKIEDPIEIQKITGEQDV